MTSRDPPPVARFDACDRAGRSFEFRQLIGEISAERLDEVLPALRGVEDAVARGGHAAGWVAYEAAPALDPALRCHAPRPDLPLVWFGIFASRREAAAPEAGEEDFRLEPWAPALAFPEYARRVAAIREWIAAGDTYQVNLTFPLRAGFAGDDLALYRRLCRSQRAGYCALLRLRGLSVISASPELFFRWSGRELELRPMKGTRPRGRWPEEDRALAEALLRSDKDRAENLMIVDLLRNDAGRVAEFGSVRVPRLFQVERYPTVHQMTSTILARTRGEVTFTDLLRALFPCGSVTGAPKVRTMQLIAELEAGPRGVYTGAVGFVSPGEAVFNVPIRTVLLDRRRGAAELGVGSGVTYDSDAEAEYGECLQKASFTRLRWPEFDLLETMRYGPEEGFLLLEEHLDRMEASAGYFDRAWDRGEARRRLMAAVEAAGAPPLRVRLLLGPGGDVRVECHALDSPPGPLRARVARRPVHSGDPLLYHKTTWRAPYRDRLAEHPGYDDVLLRNERGELTEFTIGNLVVRREGGDWTPPLASGLLPGVLRNALLRRGELRERVLHEADLAGAEAVFRINSVQGWTPVEMHRTPNA